MFPDFRVPTLVLVLLGASLGIALRLRVAHATSYDCTVSEWGLRTEIRTLEGPGSVESQQYWARQVALDLPDKVLRNYPDVGEVAFSLQLEEDVQP